MVKMTQLFHKSYFFDTTFSFISHFPIPWKKQFNKMKTSQIYYPHLNETGSARYLMVFRKVPLFN